MFGNYFGGTTDSQGGYWPDAQSKAVAITIDFKELPWEPDLRRPLEINSNGLFSFARKP